MTAKADLHVHSKHSNRPSEWVLRQFEAPESFTEPLEIYRRARARGMDFVTVSDHDSITGALEIAHLPGTFLSSEVTAAFPEDGCEIHCLVLGVSETQHTEIQRLRGNLYELRDYLRREDVVCSVAHPFFRVNNRLTLAHIEQLIVLFPRFEALNGIHDRLLNELARKILGNLTPEVVEDLAERHRLEPWGPRPWVKSFTGGSDDHGGIYIATAWTETPRTATVGEFLAHLRSGACEVAGETGSTLRLTQSLYAIAHEWYRRRFGLLLGNRRDPFSRLLRELAGEPQPKRAFSFLPARRRTVDEAPGSELDRAAFGFASRASRKALNDLLAGTVRQLRRGRLAEALGEFSRLAPLALTAAPFLVALQSQHKDQALLETAAARFLPPAERPVLPDRRAWFTDTPSEIGDVNGLATTVRTLVRTAARRGLPLTAVTCSPRRPPEDLPVHNFTPVTTFDLPGYASVRLSLPPLLDVLEHCERERYSEIMVSTPGPLGLAGLAAAKLLGLRLTGFYHTDFPAAVRNLSGSDTLAATAGDFLHWFYSQMDTVYVASQASGDQLVAQGFDRARLVVLPHGVDAASFHPDRRDAGFWRRVGLPAADDASFKFLYVGRLSREKNLDALAEAFRMLRATGRRAHLVLVGDGPYRTELARRLRSREALFTGVLHGEDLARAYASADVFVFPSTTATFGNAVLEAQASGLPAIVTDRGGAQEIVRQRGSGLVVAPTPSDLATAMIRLYDNPQLAADLAARGRGTAQQHSWELLLDELWEKPRASTDAEPALRLVREAQRDEPEPVRRTA